ncbi:MAG: hypothetical protein ACO3E9_01390 [Gemmataceae bacterium]
MARPFNQAGTIRKNHHKVLLAVGAMILAGTASMVWARKIEIANAKPLNVSKAMVASKANVKGRVVWSGDIPKVEGFSAPISPLTEHLDKPKRHWMNPNIPKINSNNMGVGSAVVFLKHGPVAESFEFEPVRVITNNFQLGIVQGGVDSQVGFVKTDGQFEILNMQNFFFSLRGRGDSFFSIPLASRGKSYVRKLEKPGMVALSSGSGQFWMRSYLFSMQHPWIARCDQDGNFELQNVPEGKQELIVWMPNWNIEDREVDAETWEITRLEFFKPLQKVIRFEALSGMENQLATTRISSNEFERLKK